MNEWLKTAPLATGFIRQVCLALCVIVVVGCRSGSSQGGSAAIPASTPSSLSTVKSCPDDIEAGAAFGIDRLPASAAPAYVENFCKYTKIDTPNGKPIHFYAQSEISNEQMIRARSILQFYLTNVPGSEYGSNKVPVANQMAENNATLILLNGSDDGEPPAEGQTLYATENVVEGSAAYLVNDPRDAAFEEILHLMHDTGIGVDGPNTLPGVPGLATYQQEIRQAMENAIPPGIIDSNGAQLGLWANGSTEWLTELAQENSLTQEYLAAIIDVYYGLAVRSSAEGVSDLYLPQTRAEIKTQDPLGWALVGDDSPRKYFSEFATYTARIDSDFDGTYSLSFDPNTRYTYKSQYLVNAQLTGSQNSNLTGNAKHNRLGGNAGVNELDGLDGEDTAVFRGKADEYSTTVTGDQVLVQDSADSRDGTVTLTNIEVLVFADRSMLFEDGELVDDENPFAHIDTLPISAQSLVSNDHLTLQLNFRGVIERQDGSTLAWTPEQQAPYIAGAKRWLEVLPQAGMLDQHMVEINIVVNSFQGGNGAAEPLLESVVVDGNNVFPTQGRFVVSNFLYTEEFTNTEGPEAAQREFDANIRHEMGHIFGIGSLWNLDQDADGTITPAEDGAGSFRNWVSNSEVHGGLIYKQPHAMAAFNAFTQSRFDFMPVSSGHLYSEEQNEPSGSARFAPDGTRIPSLDDELMANGTQFTPVLLGALKDLGWIVDPKAAD